MADVRLTATNPEDSSVVPVACDASGRLLLQELPAFDGTLDGDLTVSGKGTFGGGKSIIGNDGSAQFAQGAVDIYANGQVEFTQNVNFDGSATFASDVVLSRLFAVPTNATVGLQIANGADNNKTVFNVFNTGNVQIGTDIGNAGADISLNADGSASFADGKAGFTEEGYLWCTTRRGDTVILDATSNGLASWVEYTPTSRIDDLRDKLDAKRPDTGEMPADTQ